MGNVISDQARELLLSELAGRKRDAAERLLGLGGKIRSAESRVPEFAVDWVNQAAERVERLSDTLAHADADDVVGNAERAIKRHPLMALGGALSVGFLLGRIAKSRS